MREGCGGGGVAEAERDVEGKTVRDLGLEISKIKLRQFDTYNDLAGTPAFTARSSSKERVFNRTEPTPWFILWKALPKRHVYRTISDGRHTFYVFL